MQIRGRLLALRFRRVYLFGGRQTIIGSPLFSDLATKRRAAGYSQMNQITIEVWDATGNKKQLVTLPGDSQIERVVAVLVDKMNLPRHSPDGQLMSYNSTTRPAADSFWKTLRSKRPTSKTATSSGFNPRSPPEPAST